eukprot:GHVR01045979.1.p1 GENE.GHVR01045979.1~~GHVR01045979.1.p1  ORF type:complete len:451 (+),score=97.36 GHVR01045979.1:125-1477(+)
MRVHLTNGTPTVTVKQSTWDPSNKTFTITLTQSNVSQKGDTTSRLPLLMPIKCGLISKKTGEDLVGDVMLELREAEQTFTLENVTEECVCSVLRDFSAPVRLLQPTQTDEDRAILVGCDSDPFNKWEACQRLLTKVVMSEYEARLAGGRSVELPPHVSESLKKVMLLPQVEDGTKGDRSLVAYTLRVPDCKTLSEELSTGVDPVILHEARTHVRTLIANLLKVEFISVYGKLTEEVQRTKDTAFSVEPELVGRRTLRNTCLAYLALRDTPQERTDTAALALKHYQYSEYMTDRMAAMRVLCSMDCEERKLVVTHFYVDAKNDNLVVDKWFSLLASAELPDQMERVRELTAHKDFIGTKNPNRLRSLLRAFASSKEFHNINGKGYDMITEYVLSIDKFNPMVAGRLAATLIQWKKLDKTRQGMMKSRLEQILSVKGLSMDTYEIVSKGVKA